MMSVVFASQDDVSDVRMLTKQDDANDVCLSR